MPTAIYLEIAEQIIDELADDERSLRNCALVCQGWVPRSRTYLFREVHITTLKQLYALCCVLRSTSTLGTVVRGARIARPDATHTATIDSSATSDHPAESTTHFLNESVLDSAVVTLLSYLPNLLYWHLDALEGSLRGYFSVSARALAAFRQYAALQELRLSFLRFESTYQLYKLLRGFPVVRVLRFEGAYIHAAGMGVLGHRSQVHLLSPLLRMTALQMESTNFTWDVLHAETTYPLLEDLTFDLEYATIESCLEDIVLPDWRILCPRLVSLRIIPCQRLDLSPSCYFLEYVIQTLANGFSPTFRELVVDLRPCQAYSVFLTITDPETALKWQQLDQLLCNTKKAHPHSVHPLRFLFAPASPSWTERYTSSLSRVLISSTEESAYMIECDPLHYDHCHKNGHLKALAVSYSGEWVAIGYSDSVLYFWNVENEASFIKYDYSADNQDWILGPAFSSPHFNYFAMINGNDSGDPDGEMVVIDYEHKKSINPWHDHSNNTLSLQYVAPVVMSYICYSTSKIAYMTDHGHIGILDLRYPDREPSTIAPAVRSDSSGLRRRSAFAVSCDERWLADWHRPGALLIWDLTPDIPSLHLEYVLPMSNRHGGSPVLEEVISATFDSSHASLVAVSNCGMVWSWDVLTGMPLRRPCRLCEPSLLSPSRHVAFSPVGLRLGLLQGSGGSLKGSRAGSPSPDYSMMVYDLSAGGPYHSVRLDGHTGSIHAFSFYPDGAYVATASADHTVRLWRTSDGLCLETFTEHEAGVTHVSFSGNGSILVSGADLEDGTMHIRRTQDVLSRHSDPALETHRTCRGAARA